MSSQDNDQDIRVVAAVLISAILLAVGLAVGIGIHKARGGAGAKAAAPAAAVEAAPAAPAADAAATAPAAAPVGDDASVVVDNGVVKFYFASGKAGLATGAVVQTGQIIGALGCSGMSACAPHLHFEVRRSPGWKQGTFVDPLQWLGLGSP